MLMSSEIKAVDADDLAAVLFSFPDAQWKRCDVLIERIAVEVTEVFAGGTCTLDVGYGTLATDDVTTGGDSTDSDKDEYVPTADLTLGTLGLYWPDGGDWHTAINGTLPAAGAIISPADTTVPCIIAYVTSDDTITAGKARVYVQASLWPRL
jgi:hypothetical protein